MRQNDTACGARGAGGTRALRGWLSRGREAREKLLSRLTQQRGAALVLAMLIMVLMSLLGLAYAVLAETENLISINERHQAQALYVAEGATRLVKEWFDHPDPTTGMLVPTVGEVNRSLRHVDPDGDGTYQSYTTASAPWNVVYRSGTDDLFERPYRGGPAFSLEGTEANPDVRISDTGTTAERNYLDNLTNQIFPNFLSENLRARIRQIDVYSPPIVPDKFGGRTRFGMATIRVQVGIFAHVGTTSERQVAERVVKAVLNELAYPAGPSGPLHSCKSIGATGNFDVFWGDTTAVNNFYLHSNIDAKLNSATPYYTINRIWAPDNDSDGNPDDIDADGSADFDEWYINDLDGDGSMDDRDIEDPWIRFLAEGTSDNLLGTLDDGNPDNQPMEFMPNRQTPLDPTQPVILDADHSNIFLRVNRDLCPKFPYDLWKAIARSGERNVHYYQFDPASMSMSGQPTHYREDGEGPLRDVEDVLDGSNGLYFFDTQDSIAPHDTDGDGTTENLAPEEQLSGSFSTAGFIYLNTANLRKTGSGAGAAVVMRAPGEPFVDSDGDGSYDTNEEFLDLIYPPDNPAYSLGSYVDADPVYGPPQYVKNAWTTAASAPVGVVRNGAGPPHTEQVHYYGIVYTNGQYAWEGNAVHFGSVIAKEGVSQDGSSGGTPKLYYDERLKYGLWPPADLDIPRTFMSVWETDL